VAGLEEFIETDRNSFGIITGGSVIVPIGKLLGVKGDVRYFHGLSNVDPDQPGDIDLSGFHFFRFNVGVSLRL